MKPNVLLFSIGCAVPAATGLAAQSPAPVSSPSAPVIHEKKDDQGRLLTRITFRPDGTLTHHAVAYGPESEALTVEEDFDRKRETVRTLREQVDRRGRLVEREEMTKEGGRKVTKRTKFKYDAKGRQTVETLVTE